MGRKRILFLAEGITMAHFTRPAMLAGTLDPGEWDVYFRTPRRHHHLLGPTLQNVGDLKTLEPDRFLEALSNSHVLYPERVLEDYVRDDRAILEEIRPDLVVGDYRLSLAVSAPLAGVPFGSIFNAYWSPYRRQPAVVPELPLTRWLPPRVLNPVYVVLRPAFYALHARPLNRVRARHGLPPLSHDVRTMYTTGDLVFYPDVPEFMEVKGAPPHHHFIGTCPWPSTIARPGWWDAVMSSSGPKVLVALGSSGPLKALPAVLEALTSLGITTLLVTSGRAVGSIPANVHVADLLPYEETCSRVAAVVSHGGSSSVYPALSAGAPVLGIPANIDTHLSAAVLEESGAGLAVRVEYATAATLRRALGRLIEEPRFKTAAERWAATFARYDTKTIFPALLREWFARRRG